MPEKEVGSVAVTGTYRDDGLSAGLDSIVLNAKQVMISSQGVSTEFQRQEKQAKTLGGTLVGLGATGSLALWKLVTSSAPLQGAWARIGAALTLLSNTIGKDVKPAFDWLADKIWEIVLAFRSLDPEVRKAISYLIVLGGIVAILGGTIAGLITIIWGRAGLTAAIAAVTGPIRGLITWFLAGSTGALGLAAAIGVLVGIFAVWLAYKTGILDWISDLGSGFRGLREDGDLLANAITLILAPIALLGDAVLVLIGAKSWQDFKRDLVTIKDSFNTLKKAAEDAFKTLRGGMSFFSGGKSGGYGFGGTYDVGGMLPATGFYWGKAGETVSPVGSDTGGGGDSYMISFDGANINLASNLDIEEFADTLMRTIAWKSAIKSTSR